MTGFSEKIVFKLKGIFQSNPISQAYYLKQRKKLLNKEFILSKAYDKLALKGINDLDEFKSFKNDADQRTSNFKFRHLKYNRILGCWRWKGLWLNKEKLAPIIFNKSLKGVDFGGASGPVSQNVVVVDFAKKDLFNRPVNYQSIESINFEPDFIFTSHTLEHIDDLDVVLLKLFKVLKKGGVFIAHVPSYSCERWRPGIHKNKRFNDHKWSFYIDEEPLDIPEPKAIDQVISKYFKINNKEYTGDDSIIIWAHKV